MSSSGLSKMKKTQSREESHEWEDMPSFDAVKVSSRKRQESMIRRSATSRRVIQDHIDSLWTQSIILLLVIFDFVLAVSSIISDENTVRILTLILIIIYCNEIALRIYAFGPKRFFKSFLDVIDFAAVLGRFLVAGSEVNGATKGTVVPLLQHPLLLFPLRLVLDDPRFLVWVSLYFWRLLGRRQAWWPERFTFRRRVLKTVFEICPSSVVPFHSAASSSIIAKSVLLHTSLLIIFNSSIVFDTRDLIFSLLKQ